MDRTQTADECLWVIDENDLKNRSIDAVWPVSAWRFKVLERLDEKIETS
jgi:hypothetical protein